MLYKLMSPFFNPNLDRRGRIVRAVSGLALALSGLFIAYQVRWLGLILILAGIFMLFEAFRGWCLLRACGVKTRL